MIVDCKTQNCSGQLNSNGGFRCPTTPEQKKYRKGLCMGTTLNYIMKSAALFDVTNNNTIKAYKKNIEDFCDWSKKILGITKSQVLDNPITVVQAYSDMLYRQYPATTAHKYLSPICKGLGIHLQDISKPKRTARLIKGRDDTKNLQGKKELKFNKSPRLVAFQEAVGIRRKELAKLRPVDVIQTSSGDVYVHVLRGKGGKEQYQYVLPADRDIVISIAASSLLPDRIFTQSEMTNKIDLHSIRAVHAKDAYKYYADKIATDPRYKVECIKKLVSYFEYMNDKKDPKYVSHFARFKKDIVTGGYKYRIRGENARIAKEKGLPLTYNRVALMMVSVFHLSHWRNDVTIKNYMIR